MKSYISQGKQASVKEENHSEQRKKDAKPNESQANLCIICTTKLRETSCWFTLTKTCKKTQETITKFGNLETNSLTEKQRQRRLILLNLDMSVTKQKKSHC